MHLGFGEKPLRAAACGTVTALLCWGLFHRLLAVAWPQSLLGDAFEALIGAVYLDKGYDFTRNFLVNHIIKAHIDIHKLEQTETNFKSKLIEWCQRHGKDIVFYLVSNEDGENTKLFTVQAQVDGEVMGHGKEFSKKNAEKLAAEKACETLGI